MIFPAHQTSWNIRMINVHDVWQVQQKGESWDLNQVCLNTSVGNSVVNLKESSPLLGSQYFYIHYISVCLTTSQQTFWIFKAGNWQEEKCLLLKNIYWGTWHGSITAVCWFSWTAENTIQLSLLFSEHIVVQFRGRLTPCRHSSATSVYNCRPHAAGAFFKKLFCPCLQTTWGHHRLYPVLYFLFSTHFLMILKKKRHHQNS